MCGCVGVGVGVSHLIPPSLLSSLRPEFPMVLVANKADLEGERVVSVQEGEALAIELKVCVLYGV